MVIKISSQLQGSKLVDELLDRQALAELLGSHVPTVDRLHHLSRGPARIKVGSKIYYRALAVLEWLRQNETGNVLGEVK